MPRGTEHQPVAAVEWVRRERLRANGYNPNHVAPEELRLLKRSILATGWTQPIVARADGEIVDGFHRWTVAADQEIAALTGGLVPVVRLAPETSLPDQVAATIRHNRARGEHAVIPMAEIVRALIADHGWEPRQIQAELGMEGEEVRRLANKAGMPVTAGQVAFGNGWTPR